MLFAAMWAGIPTEVIAGENVVYMVHKNRRRKYCLMTERYGGLIDWTLAAKIEWQPNHIMHHKQLCRSGWKAPENLHRFLDTKNQWKRTESVTRLRQTLHVDYVLRGAYPSPRCSPGRFKDVHAKNDAFLPFPFVRLMITAAIHLLSFRCCLRFTLL